MRNIIAIMILSMALALTGCATKKKKPAVSEQLAAVDNISDLDVEINADSDSGKAGLLQTVYFDFNSSQLTSSARAALKDNAEFLKKFKQVDVQIEGHCDERGGVQYNIALGEKRANSIRGYLSNIGIASSRITTVTFGKERPIEFGHDESSWSKNRRGNFVITAISAR
ncbi:MAG: peptidoglycan-associated lipoprotein Pal [Bacteriovoracaceae bacterium]|nr:peptidoglycan-associated lipoprotein Pal [Bacteriovoracaceae bacterium]